MLKYLAILLPLLFPLHSAAQNGKLLERTPYAVPQPFVADARERIPDLDTVLARVSLSRITYLSDGLKVTGYLAMPLGDGPFPCVIYNRGGNREFGRISEGQLTNYIARMASWGYVVVGSQYRGNDGGEGHDEFGGADVDDVLHLLPVLAQVAGADTSRIGMFGGSRGGLMTYLALARTQRIKAAAVQAGMSDAFASASARPDMDSAVFAQVMPRYAVARDSVLASRSPVRWADKLCKTTPILILHGTSDWRVEPAQSLAMAEALLRCRHPFRYFLFEGADHSLSEFREEANDATRLFLDTYVRDGKAWPSLEPHGN